MTSEQKRAAGLTRVTIWIPTPDKSDFMAYAAEQARQHVHRSSGKCQFTASPD